MSNLFFDVDGTLVDPLSHKIPQSTITAITKAQKNGHKCFIATGRHLYKLLEVKDIQKIKWDGYILDNGSLILDHNFNTVFAHHLTSYQVREVINTCKQQQISCSLQLYDKTIFPLGTSQYVRNTFKFLDWKETPSIQEYQDEKVIYMMIYYPQNSDIRVFQNIDGIQCFANNSDYADINVAGITKATGITTISNHYKLNVSTYAFGDGNNDLEMLSAADNGIAMGNASQELKKISDYITDNVDADGIYHALIHYKLI